MLLPEPVVPRFDVPCVEDLLLAEGYLSSTDKTKWLQEHLLLSKERIKEVFNEE